MHDSSGKVQNSMFWASFLVTKPGPHQKSQNVCTDREVHEKMLPKDIGSELSVAKYS